ncbi:MAG: hypothetical protein E7381_01140 [Clostridiales bacterium]|nr:hypothetical protein [Clostridiales bacterium]
MLYTLLALFEGLTPMNGENLIASLHILWKGLLAIFIVIALIIIAVKLCSYCIAKCAQIKQRMQENASENDTDATEN